MTSQNSITTLTMPFKKIDNQILEKNGMLIRNLHQLISIVSAKIYQMGSLQEETKIDITVKVKRRLFFYTFFLDLLCFD